MGKTRREKNVVVNPNDMYETPPWCVDILATLCGESLLFPEMIVDIGAGDGRIGGAMKITFWNMVRKYPRLIMIDPFAGYNPWYKGAPYTDGAAHVDECFLEWSAKQEPIQSQRVMFASNPPFSKSFEIVERTVSILRSCCLGSVAVFLLKLNWFATKTRAEWITKNPPNRMVGLAPRPVFGNKYKDNPKGQSDMAEYAWTFWFNGDASKLFWPYSVRIKKV